MPTPKDTGVQDMRENTLRVAVITGTKAYPIIVEMVQKALEKHKNVDVDIVLLPFSVIGMVNVNAIKTVLLRNQAMLERLRQADYVLLPGKVLGDASELEKIVKRPVYKGTSEPSHLSELLNLLIKGKELSRIEPADKYVASSKLELFLETLKEINSSARVAFELGGVRVPSRGPPVLVASETTVTLTPEEAAEQAAYYERMGADIIIVGVPYGEDTETSLRRLRLVENAVNNSLVAIDSASPHTLKKALEKGVELVFSLHSGNMDYLRNYSKKAGFVIIPGNPYKGIAPSSEGEAVGLLLKNIEMARRRGFDKLLADLVLPPPILGLARVVSAYLEIGRTLPDIPLMAGLANVTELVDADSIGVNALLSILAVEVGVSMVLVSEESWKARGSTLETKLGLALASVAKAKGSAPVGLGIDLLVSKDKKKPFSKGVWEESDKIVDAVVQESHPLDKWGYVVVDVDYKMGHIYACIHIHGKRGVTCYRGEEPLSILRRVLDENPQFTASHAGYLGVELQKAWTALKMGKQYVQDEPLRLNLQDKYQSTLEKIIGSTRQR